MNYQAYLAACDIFLFPRANGKNIDIVNTMYTPMFGRLRIQKESQILPSIPY